MLVRELFDKANEILSASGSSQMSATSTSNLEWVLNQSLRTLEYYDDSYAVEKALPLLETETHVMRSFIFRYLSECASESPNAEDRLREMIANPRSRLYRNGYAIRVADRIRDKKMEIEE